MVFITFTNCRPHDHRRRRGFGLIGPMMVCAIFGNTIAWFAALHNSNATDSAVAQNVQVMRSAVDLYHTEHAGKYPRDNGGVTVKDLLTQYSNRDGTAVAQNKDRHHGIIYGPYLRMIPPLPLGPKRGATGIGNRDGQGIAWVYNPRTGEIRANLAGKDRKGKSYAEY